MCFLKIANYLHKQTFPSWSLHQYQEENFLLIEAFMLMWSILQHHGTFNILQALKLILCYKTT